MKHGNWIDDLRQREQNYEEENLPEGLFDDIMAHVPQQRQRKAIPLWMRYGAVAAAAAVALLIGVGSLMRLNGDMATENVAETLSVEATSASQTDNKSDIDNAHPLNNTDPTTTAKKPLQRIFAAIKHAVAGQEEEPVLVATVETEPIATIEKAPSTQKKPAVTKSKDKQNSEKTASIYTGGQTLADDFEYKDKKHRPALSASVYASGRGGSNNDWGDEAVFMDNPSYMGVQDFSNGTDNWGVEESETDITEPQSSSQPEAHHDIPLRFGVAVAVALNDKISIESGVTYTRLHSEIDNPMGIDYSSYNQTLHYVGVPLRVNYSLWESKRANVYVKAGAMAEKLIASSVDNGSSAEMKAPSEHRLQFSIGAAAGASLKLNDEISLFVEPGVSHYFDNGSSIISIYKDRPTTFDLTLGVRIGF